MSLQSFEIVTHKLSRTIDMDVEFYHDTEKSKTKSIL